MASVWRRMVRLVLALTALLTALTTPAPALGASAYQQVLRVYEQQAAIPPCHFTAGELEAALRGTDSYGAQYFADFTQAVQDALAARASGGCARRPPGRRRAPHSRGGPGIGVPAHLAALTSPGGAVPAPLIALAVLGVAGAAVTAVSLARRR